MIEGDGATIACPVCGSQRIRPSKRFKLADLLRAAKLMRSYRCRDCRSRFPVRTASLRMGGSLRGAIRRRLHRIWKQSPGNRRGATPFILLGAAALVLLFLYWLARMPV